MKTVSLQIQEIQAQIAEIQERRSRIEQKLQRLSKLNALRVGPQVKRAKKCCP